MDVKKIIRGFAKYTGKYTLKGLAKGTELIGRGGIKVVEALVKNPIVQTIGTMSLGPIIPEVVAASVMLGGIRLMTSALFSKKDINGKFRDAINTGNLVTRTVGSRIIAPLLNRADKGIGRIGDKVQNKIDDLFK